MRGGNSCDRICTKLSASHSNAGDLRRGSAGVRRSVACGATVWWLIAGVLLGLVIPFTLIVILPTNKRLLSPALDRRSAEAEGLLAHWGRLHAVRSVLSGVALLLFLCVAIFRKAI